VSNDQGGRTVSKETLSKTNLEVVQTMVDAFARGEIDEALSCLADDLVVHEPATLPYAGDWHGPAGFLKMVEGFMATWEFKSELTSTAYDGGGDLVFLRVQADVVSVATGKPLSFKIVEVYTVRDGKIADIDVFYKDTAEMVAAISGVATH
jgi:ketosteroid isomerase-like protein